MKIGFLTGCLGDIPLYEKAKFARSAGFQALEISAWPKENTRDYSGSDIDFETFDAQEAQKIRTYLDDMGLEISAMAYYDNNLDCDPVHRKQINDHLKKVILAAEMLGTELVGGIPPRTWKEILMNLKRSLLHWCSLRRTTV